MGRLGSDYRNILRLLGYVLRYKFALFMAVFCMILFAGSMFGKVYMIQTLMDKVIAPADEKGDIKKSIKKIVKDIATDPEKKETKAEKKAREDLERKNLEERGGILLEILIIVFILAFASAISHFGKEYFRRYIMHRVVVDIRNEVSAHLLTLSLDFYDERRGGDIINRMTIDLQVTMKALSFILGDVIQAPIMICAGIVVAFFLSWHLAVITFLIVPALILILIRYGKRIRKYSRQSLERLADVTDHMMQMFSGIRIVKAFGLEEYEKHDLEVANDKYFGRAMKMVANKALAKGLMELFNNICIIVLVGIGSYLVITGWGGLTLGILAAFIGILGALSQPLRQVIHAGTEFSEAIAGSERVFHLAELKPTVTDRDGARPLERVEKEIAFKDITFRYDEKTPYVLKGVSFTAEVGKVYAFVGKTGAGKSTMMDLIPRFYNPTSGTIEIDGVSYFDFTHKSLLKQIAIVGQHPFLFNTSIKENIRMGRLDATDEEIFAAAEAANVAEFAEKKPDKYETLTGERGDNLSGGERQRITIARAILKDAAILILDEATSSLDSASEKLVQDALQNLMAGRTTFVVAHRLSTIQRADVIFVIDDGQIVEKGNHEELLKQNGIYAGLYKQQFNINN